MRRVLGILAVFHTVVFNLRLFGEVEGLENFWFSVAGKLFCGASLIGGIVAAVYFAVDSVRREYLENRELAIAVAMIGVLTFGFLTVVYYVVWGWRPPEADYTFDFCDTCLEASEECGDDISLVMVNFVNGGKLIGRSERCPECGSEIRTHCFFIFGIPLFSRGSFRAVVPGRDQVLLRRLPFYWPHLVQILLVPAIIGTFVFAAWTR